MMDPIEAAMAAVRRRFDSPAWVDDFCSPAPVGPELDALETEIPPEQWSENRRATVHALRAIKPMQKLAVLTMARDEAPYLPEFIAHYRAIGADKIFVYTNDSIDGTDRLLRWAGNNAPVVPIFTQVGPRVNVQQKNYHHALLLLPELRLFDWVLVVDLDEFLVPGAQYNHHLPTLLAAAPRDTDVILFPWRWRLWDRSFERQPGLLPERYQHANPHDLFKPVMRLRKVYSLHYVHMPFVEPGAVVRDTAFNEIIHYDIWSKTPKTEAGGWIDHYWGRSFEEFCVKKRRGDALELETLFKREHELFFQWSAWPGPENHRPMPEAMLAAVKRELAKLEARPGYREIMAGVTAFYEDYFARLRADAEVRQIYEVLLAQFPRP